MDVLLKHHINLSEFLVVSDPLEENLSLSVKFVFKASVSNFLEISLIWLRDEVLKLTKVFISTLGVGIDELRVNNLFLKSFSSHEKESD